MLNDTQRVLQTLVNTAHVENKNHNMLTKYAGAENAAGLMADEELKAKGK